MSVTPKIFLRVSQSIVKVAHVQWAFFLCAVGFQNIAVSEAMSCIVAYNWIPMSVEPTFQLDHEACYLASITSKTYTE